MRAGWVLLMSAALASASASGEIAGVHEPSGSVRYSIPILVPAGPAGHAPGISLEYDSQKLRGGAGAVGLSWSIRGLSRIERDRKFGPAYDYASTACAPELCYLDHFVLDGGDLICSDEPCTTRYRTQVDDGRWIEFHGDAQGWEIRDRQGRRFFYGETAAARLGVESTRNGQVFAWLLERIEDPSGNWIRFSYTQGDGVKYPNQIEYAQSGAPGNRRIRFLPETFDSGSMRRPDAAIDYGAGFRQVVDRRLAAILVEARDAAGSWRLVTRYELGYAQSPDSDRSLLVSVQRSGEVDGQTESLPPHRFSYSESSHGFAPKLPWAPPWVDGPVEWHTGTAGWAAAMDFNGDALADYVTARGFDDYSGDFGTSPTSVYINLGHDEAGLSPSDPNYSPFRFQVDVYPEDPAAPRPDHPLPYRDYEQCGINCSWKLRSRYEALRDLNGDGYLDYVRMTEDGTGLITCEEGWPVRFGGATGLSPTSTIWRGVAPNDSADPMFDPASLNSVCALALSHDLSNQWAAKPLQAGLLDITGDGRPDRVLSNQNGPSPWRVGVNDGSGFLPLIDWPTSDPDRIEEHGIDNATAYSQLNRSALLMDLNGDGLLDRLYKAGDWLSGASDWEVAYSYGAGFEPLEPFGYEFDYMRRMHFSLEGLDVDLRDLNGDGFPDQILDLGSDFQVWLGTGSGFRTSSLLWSKPPVFDNCFLQQSVPAMDIGGDLADYNGDGLLDRSCDTLESQTPGYRGAFGYIALNAGPVPDLLVAAESPLGGSAVFEYGHAAGEQIEGPAVAHPELAGPRWVVKRLSLSAGRPEDPDIVDEFAYLGGTYDRYEHEFRAFELVTRSRLGAGGVAESSVVSMYRTDRACAGRLETRDVYSGGERMSGESYEYAGLPPQPAGAAADQQWTACLLMASTFESVEGDEAAGKLRRIERDYGTPVDPFYNVRVIREFGEWDPLAGADVPGDERFTFIEYATPIDPNHYLVSKPSLRRIEESTGEVRSSTRFLYDSLENPASPQVALGRLTAVERWLHSDIGSGGDRWVPVETREYDAFGNVSASLGAETPVVGGGTTRLRRETSYDGVYETFPVSTTLGVGTATPLTTTRAYTGCAGGEPPPALGLPCRVTTPQGLVASFGYDPLGRTRATQSPTGLRTRLDLFLPGASGPAETLIRRTLDFADEDTPDLVHQEYRDGLGRAYRVETPGKTSEVIVVERSFDARGRLASETLPRFSGETAQLARQVRYDGLGRVTRRIDFDGSTSVRHSYTPWQVTEDVYFGDPEAPIAADRQRRTERSFDGLGRIEQVRLIEDPASPGTAFSIQAEYDAMDRLRTLRDPVQLNPELCQTHGMAPSCATQAHTTEAIYDTLGNRLRLIDPDAGTWDYVYSDSGLLLATSDPRQEITSSAYDDLERVRTRTVGDETWSFGYHATAGPAHGQLAWIEGTNVSRSFEYDAFGRVAEQTQTHADMAPSLAFTSSYSYDELDRVTLRGFPDRTSATYSYDGLRLVGIAIDDTRAPLSGADYDALGRPIFLARDGAGVVYGPQAPLYYEYDGPGGRLSRILATRQHSFYGTTETVLDARLGFDGLGRPSFANETSVDAAGGAPQTIDRSFQYDGLGRLSWAEGPWERIYGRPDDVAWSFSYDPLDNIRSLTSDSGAYGREWTYDDASRPRFLTRFVEHTSGAPDLVQVIAPDVAGNTATVALVGGGVQQFDWNGYGRLETIQGRGFRNDYDAFGRRVRQHVTTSTLDTDIIYVGDDFEYDVELEQSNAFFFVGGIRIASSASFCPPADCYSTASFGIPRWLQRELRARAAPAAGLLALVSLLGAAALTLGIRRPVWIGGAGVGGIAICLVLLPYAARSGSAGRPSHLGSHAEGLVFYVPDHLGSTRAVISWYGELIETRDYDPWGRTIAHGGDFAQKHQFTGQPFEFDEAEAGPKLHDYGARMYDSLWARFVSPDELLASFDAQGLNRYAYVRNQPTALVDPTGNYWVGSLGQVQAATFQQIPHPEDVVILPVEPPGAGFPLPADLLSVSVPRVPLQLPGDLTMTPPSDLSGLMPEVFQSALAQGIEDLRSFVAEHGAATIAVSGALNGKHGLGAAVSISSDARFESFQIALLAGIGFGLGSSITTSLGVGGFRDVGVSIVATGAAQRLANPGFFGALRVGQATLGGSAGLGLGTGSGVALGVSSPGVTLTREQLLGWLQ